MLSPMPRRNPMLTPFLFFAVGLGMLGWYGLAWRDLPVYSEYDMAASVEANLAADLSRLGPEVRQNPKELERMRAEIRLALKADIDRERGEVEQGLGIGLICLVAALGNFVLVRGLQRSAP
jgi:hypothetical protein